MIRMSTVVYHHVKRLVAWIVFHEFLLLLCKYVCERLIAHDKAVWCDGYFLVVAGTIKHSLWAYVIRTCAILPRAQKLGWFGSWSFRWEAALLAWIMALLIGHLQFLTFLGTVAVTHTCNLSWLVITCLTFNRSHAPVNCPFLGA